MIRFVVAVSAGGRASGRTLGRRALRAAALSIGVLAAGGGVAAAQSVPCSDLSEFCQSLVPSTCVETLGAGAVGTEAASGCAMIIGAYRQCLEKVASACSGPAASQAAAAPTSEPQSLRWGRHEVTLERCVAAEGAVRCRLTLVPAYNDNFTVYSEYFPILIGDGLPEEPIRFIFGSTDATNGLAASVRADGSPVQIRLTFEPREGAAPGAPYTLTVFRHHSFDAVLE